MLWRNTKLDTLTEADLQELIAEDVMELKTLEYKSALPDGSDSGKRKFLQEVTSLANTAGGYIIFGINAPKGRPIGLTGLITEDADGEKLRLEHIILRGVRPRISGILTHAIPLTEGRWAIIVRVPRSHAGPHMVSHSEHFEFYARNSQGKYPMDVDDLRTQFLLSESLFDKIRAFRKERLELVHSGSGPKPLADGPVVMLHAVPVDGFDRAASVDMAVLMESAPQIGSILGGTCGAPNFDGVLSYGGPHGAAAVPRYVQAFRNGIIECASVKLFDDDRQLIPSVSYELDLMGATNKILSLLESWGFEPPIFIMLTLAGVRGYTMGAGLAWSHHARLIDRDTLQVPEIVVDDPSVDAGRLLKPAFDAVWNACGFPGSLNYDNDGSWCQHR